MHRRSCTHAGSGIFRKSFDAIVPLFSQSISERNPRSSNSFPEKRIVVPSGLPACRAMQRSCYRVSQSSSMKENMRNDSRLTDTYTHTHIYTADHLICSVCSKRRESGTNLMTTTSITFGLRARAHTHRDDLRERDLCVKKKGSAIRATIATTSHFYYIRLVCDEFFSSFVQ